LPLIKTRTRVPPLALAASHLTQHLTAKMSSAAAMTWTGKVVCVTGASGYIASWIVKLLLARGYTVRATVRDTADPKKTLHLRVLDGAKDRLHLFKASLLEEGSFDAAVDGCDCVFHTASPFYHNVKDPKAELLEPAVKGTLNVLASCKKASIKRVVITSSMAAVAYNGKSRTPDTVVDETWFSDPEVCEKNQQWYVLSKTLAEEAAWKFSRDNGLEIVTINPTMVIGPLLQPTLNTRSSTYPNSTFGWINVKDVALAHVLAYEVPSANGRYCMVETVTHHSDLVNIIREMYPTIPLPDKCADDKPFVATYQVSKEKITSLGIQLTPLKTSLKETIESLKEKGFITFDSTNM
ncbi:Cinnamoyl-CoA reductase 1, partial [Dichanthelium oligosanthes]